MKIYITDKERHCDDPVIVQHYFMQVGRSEQILQLAVQVGKSDVVVTQSEILTIKRSEPADGFVDFTITIPENTTGHYINYVIEFTTQRGFLRIIKQCVITQTLENGLFLLCASKLCSTNRLS